MKIGYLDCFSGISGDMTLGALLDLGFSESDLREGLAGLPVDEYTIRISRQKRQGMAGVHVEVAVDEGKQPSRSYAQIRKIISESALPVRAREMAEDIFARIARAEAHVHGVSMEEVHFHEVGAVDSIVDIVGVALGFDALGIEKCYVSPLPLGGGFVRSSHGILPVPAPATVEILNNMRVKEHPSQAELVTPTGAAIAACLASPDHPPLPPIRIQRVGYGAGSREDAVPNLLRFYLGESADGYETDDVQILECQIDDLQPELFPFLMERLLESGARDVCFIPVQMKKGRQGILVQVISDPACQMRLVEILFTETTTLGVRIHKADRIKLSRKEGQLETSLGPVAVKIVEGPCLEKPEVRPEYEACKRVAIEKGVPLKAVYEAVVCADNSCEHTDLSRKSKKPGIKRD